MQLLTARPKSRGTVGLKSTNPFDLAKVSFLRHTVWHNSHCGVVPADTQARAVIHQFEAVCTVEACK